jgi:NAD(P)-dependent dehydrogenase (short-subunit alcohol dehydrogenase family)
MRNKGQGGSIVNIASIGGHAGIPGQQNAVYCASKGAILSFTKSLAVELAQEGIRVNSVSPGFFLTKVTPGYLTQDVARLEGFERLVPMGRFADRYELKSLVAFLLTPAASYITGEDIAVDGGVLAG